MENWIHFQIPNLILGGMHQFYKVTLANRVHIVKSTHYSKLKNYYFHYLVSHTINYFFRDWLIDFYELCYFTIVSAAIFYQCSFPLYAVQISTVSTKAVKPPPQQQQKKKEKKKTDRDPKFVSWPIWFNNRPNAHSSTYNSEGLPASNKDWNWILREINYRDRAW